MLRAGLTGGGEGRGTFAALEVGLQATVGSGPSLPTEGVEAPADSWSRGDDSSIEAL